jgi:fatty acid desaturase
MKPLFAYSRWDVVPVLAGMIHLAFVVWLIVAFDQFSLWQLMLMGVVYAIAISWNINGISHNFLHNPYFVSPRLNRAFSLIESLAVGFSQQFYTWVHLRHHSGNSDVPDADGKTIDWLSIYRHGKNGEAENVWRYVLLSFFRDDLVALYRALKKQNPANARFGLIEIGCFAAFVLAGFFYNWKAMLFLVPFYYLGNCLSSLNGYYEHYRGNPSLPIAWGVSSYNRFYNWLWFNNGYHAEHHFRPKMHWTKMRHFHAEIKDQQVAAKVRVLKQCHALGFIDAMTEDRREAA